MSAPEPQPRCGDDNPEANAGSVVDDGFEPQPADPNEHADGAPCSDLWCTDKTANADG